MYIHRLTPDDWEAFRDIHLHALKTEPSVFGMSHVAGLTLTPINWQAILGPPGAVFGVYDGSRLVGITAVRIEAKHPARTVAMGMSYLYPEYRGGGLSHLMFEARFRWIIEQGCFDCAVVSHRAGNVESRRAILSAGFHETHTVMSTWPDGSKDEEVWYALGLPPLVDD